VLSDIEKFRLYIWDGRISYFALLYSPHLFIFFKYLFKNREAVLNVKTEIKQTFWKIQFRFAYDLSFSFSFSFIDSFITRSNGNQLNC